MHSSELTAVKFSTTKWREGYDMAQVDAFMKKARVALQFWEGRRPAELTSAEVVGLEFQPTKFRSGYDQDQVDDFRDLIVAALREYETGQRRV